MQARRGVANGLAYISGMTAFRLALGALFWVLLSGVEEAVESGGRQFGLIVGTVMVVLGIALLFYGLRYAFSANEVEKAEPTWLCKLGDVTPAKAALIGFAMLALDPKDWRSKGLAGGSSSRRHGCGGRSERRGQFAGLSMVRSDIAVAGLYSVDPGTGSTSKSRREPQFDERLAGKALTDHRHRCCGPVGRLFPVFRPGDDRRVFVSIWIIHFSNSREGSQ